MAELEATSNPAFQKIKFSSLTGDAKWKDIEDLINRWARRNPAGAYMTEKYIRATREDLIDKKHGLMGGKGGGDTNAPNTRIGVAIHPELMNYIQAFYPTFMDTKEDLHEFKRRFPKFRVSESI